MHNLIKDAENTPTYHVWVCVTHRGFKLIITLAWIINISSQLNGREYTQTQGSTNKS